MKKKYIYIIIALVIIIGICLYKRREGFEHKNKYYIPDTQGGCHKYESFWDYFDGTSKDNESSTLSHNTAEPNTYMRRMLGVVPEVKINKNADRDLLGYYGDQDKWIFTKEGFTNDRSIGSPNFRATDDTNFRNWPYYYYGNPNPGGSFPPAMFSRLRNIEPGFQPNGLSYDLRPGVKYRDWVWGRWQRNNGAYNYINNL